MRVKKADLGPLTPLAKGGLGEIFRVTSYHLPGDWVPLAYKEFTADRAAQARSAEAAVTFRAGLQQEDRDYLDRFTSWPRAVVVDASGSVTGHVIPLIASDFFMKMLDPDSAQLASRPREMGWLIATEAQLRAARADIPGIGRDDRLVLLAQLARVIGFLHQHGWVFGDLCFRNVVFALDPPRVMLLGCDGVAALTDTWRRRPSTPFWDPPEWSDKLLSGQQRQQDDVTDVYKLGLAVLRGLTPGKGAATTTNVGRLVDELDQEGIDLVTRALSSDRESRPSAWDLASYLDRQVSAGTAAPDPVAPTPVQVTSRVTVFEVSISPGSVAGSLRVEVVNSPAGQASAMTSLDSRTLIARRAEFQNAVLESAVPRRRVLTESEQCVQEIGQSLFSALLGAGDVAGLYRASAALAGERGQRLRVVLRIDEPILAALPWEAMYDQGAGGYLCRRTELVRHVPILSAAVPMPVKPPLRVLAMVSAPYDLSRLDVHKEREQLARALAGPVAAGLVKLEWAPSATWADLQDMLLGGTWHVLHYIGHGDFDIRRDEGILALTREDGQADLVEASRLVDLLCQARPVPRLAVLNSCSGAVTGVTDLFSGTAAALVRGGISAAAAMQYEISDQAAIAFTRGFYGAIAHGRGVDEAVSSGRVAILGLSSQTLEWVTPVLYLRPHNSHLLVGPPKAF